VKLDLVGLVAVMFLATYPSRALPLLSGHFEWLSPRVLEYLRLVAPAVLAALAAKSTFVTDAQGAGSLHVGIEWLAVPLCIVLVAWRRNLFVGLLAAVVLVAGARAAGLA
jgi:branched-subunit amino acid transport protein